MKFKVNLAVVLVVIVSLRLMLASCGGLQPAPSIGGMDITGVWKQEDGEAYSQFNEDGTYRIAHTLAFLEKAPFEV